MKLPRRKFLHLAAGIAALPAVSRGARAQVYPSRPVRIVAAPRNTPADIVDKVNKEINAGLADAKLKARIADLGGNILGGSPAGFGKLIADETEKWGKVVRGANMKAE